MQQTQWDFRKGLDLIKLPWIINSVWDVITAQCLVFPLNFGCRQQIKKGLDRFIKGGDFQWAEKVIFCDAYWGHYTIKKDEYCNGISYWKVNMDYRDKVKRQPVSQISISNLEISP